MIKPTFASVAALFPITLWSRNYTTRTAIGDLIAGVTVALTLVPQSIAYAGLAGFEPQYGLYASFVGGIVYAFLGTCPQINIGPSALLSLLTFTYTNGTNPNFAILLCFISGIVQIVAGIARLGFLVEFVSLPVVSGFTSAAAVTIATSQLKGLLGLKFSAEGFISTWVGVIKHVSEIRLPDTLLSIVCCIILMGMKKIKDMKLKVPADKKKRRKALICNRSLWFIGVSRNAVVVAIATLTAFFVHENSSEPFLLTGKITPGLPSPRPPAFYTEVGNTTYTGWEMLGHLGSGLLVVPLVGIISNVAIAKAFARGKTLSATQEIVALGICNVVGSFFKSFPVNGSFSRSAVSDASGVRTPAAGFYTGFIVIVTLIVLTPYFYFIPRAALASVIVCAVLHMIDVDIVFRLWKTAKLDLIPLFGTFVCCLALGIEVGLVCGVVIDAILLMYYQSRPSLHLKYVNDGILPPHYAITPAGGLHFAGAEAVRSQLIALQENKNKRLQNIAVVNGNDMSNGQNVIPNGQNVILNGQNMIPNGNNVIPHGQNVLPNGQNEIMNDQNAAVNGENIGPNNHYERNEVTNSQNEQMYTVQVCHNRQINTLSAKNILVIYCKSLNMMDYTFLESIKSLTMSWSHHGLVIWCDVQPHIKNQLDYVLRDIIYCDSEGLKRFLLSVTSANESQTANIGDTHL